MRFLTKSKKKATAEETAPVAATAAPVTATAVAEPPVKKAPAVAPAKPAAEGGPRRGISLAAIAVSFLLVAAITAAAGTTLVAIRMIDERNKLETQYNDSAMALDQIVHAAATTSRLKGPANIKAREEIFAPAIAYYKKIADKVSSPERPDELPEIASARFHLAALQAKTGQAASAQMLNQGVEALAMMDKAGLPPEQFPKLTPLMGMTEPLNWILVKDAKPEDHAMVLVFMISKATGQFRALKDKHPQSIGFREDLVTVNLASAALQSQAKARVPWALTAWKEARDVLETLVRDQPGNVTYQQQLAQCLTDLAACEQREGKTADAAVNYKRAVEVRQQMVDANPEDKDLAKALEAVKAQLAKLPAAAPAAPSDGAAEEPADAASEEPADAAT